MSDPVYAIAGNCADISLIFLDGYFDGSSVGQVHVSRDPKAWNSTNIILNMFTQTSGASS